MGHHSVLLSDPGILRQAYPRRRLWECWNTEHHRHVRLLFGRYNLLNDRYSADDVPLIPDSNHRRLVPGLRQNSRSNFVWPIPDKTWNRLLILLDLRADDGEVSVIDLSEAFRCLHFVSLGIDYTVADDRGDGWPNTALSIYRDLFLLDAFILDIKQNIGAISTIKGWL